jgi:hypothetical protein
MRWDPGPVFPHRDGPPSAYRSDPYTYLQHAREMRSFYAASLREPLFPAATRVSLYLLGDQDVAVSFASAAFSVLAVLATFLLGAEAFSFAVGLGAAFLLAIEFYAITWAIEGWRDDMFMCAVVLAAWALLRCARAPTRRNAIVLGAIAAAACLVRITAVSFLVPGFIYLVAVPKPLRRERVKAVAIAVAVAVLLVAPYLVNCWRAFGDPLYSIDAHADVYRATDGQPVENSQTAREYLVAEARARPLRTLDTIVLGMTRYPFVNKWTGFEPWGRYVGRSLLVLALAGLLGFAVTPAGRLLLLVLAASLEPYAATWRLIRDWRFTEHAYPFLLIAACAAMACPVRAIAAARSRTFLAFMPSRRDLIWGAGACGLVIAWAVLWRLMPALTFKEALRSNDSATIMAGDRDGSFFREGWPGILASGNVTLRIADNPRASVDVPLPSTGDYDALVRVDAAPFGILMNGRLIARCDPSSTPERIGACRFRIPADATRKDPNRLTFAQDAPGAMRVWYIRLQRSPE